MTDSNWEALAEIFFHCSSMREIEEGEYINCLCSRVLVKNQTEAVAMEQEELSEAYDIFNEQYCENHAATMNRIASTTNHSQDEEDSDANSCYYSATDSGADISEYHGIASTSRELFKRSHRDESGKSSSTSVEREQNDLFDEKELSEQWEKYWSENCERFIWTSWIEKYSDYINPEYLQVEQQNATNKLDTKELQLNQISNPSEIKSENITTEIVVSGCSPSTSTNPINDLNDTNEELANLDAQSCEFKDSLLLPRCDSTSSSIPLTIGTTDSMTNVTQITLSSYGFCSSPVSSSENSQLSESTPSSVSTPFNFDENDETKIETMNEEDSADQQWQLLWQQHYQEQYNKYCNEFMIERKQLKCSNITKSFPNEDKPLSPNEFIEFEDDDAELRQLAELGLPTSFGSKCNAVRRRGANQRQTDDSDRVKAAFTLMGLSYENLESNDTITNGHVVYRKREKTIRFNNNMLKLKKKRFDVDSSARDEALISLIADSSSDETDKPISNINLIKTECFDAKIENAEKSDSTIADEHMKSLEEEVNKFDLTDEPKSNQIPTSNTIDIEMENVTKSTSKKSKKKRRQNKILAGLPTEIANDRTLFKYWCKRFSLFSLFDQGIKLDRESWFSVTPEKVAIYTAMRCQCDIIVDAFCGAGGNTIQFAKTCKRVIAIDIDEKKIEMAKHNASIYGVNDKIDFIVGDYFQLASSLKADVVFLSPPWGGISYIKEDIYDIEKSLLPLPATQLINLTRQITSNIAIYLPRNTNTKQLAMLAGRGNSVEIEQGFLDRKFIAITAFYGNLLKNFSS